MTQGYQLVLLLAQIMTVGSAIVVAFHPNILYAAIALLFAFLGVAAMFVYAAADILAGIQVIVYVGGVTILVLFAIMLTQWLYSMKLVDVGAKLLIPTVLGAGIFYTLFVKGLKPLAAMITAAPPENLAKFITEPKTALVGSALLGNYLLAFEAITILLLGALVGAVWLARPK